MILFFTKYSTFSGTQALIDEGLEPDQHVFQISTDKKAVVTPVKRTNAKTAKTNGTEKEQEEEDEEDDSVANDTTGDDEVALDDVDELVVKDEADDGDEIVDEVGEVDKESFEEIQKFSESDRNSGNDANNADNELLHLTIDEDEEKIFQDRVSIC